MRCVGTTVRGIRTPIINEGDDIVQIVIDSLLEAQKQEGFEFHNKDVIAITESVVARAQGNYATVDQIAADVRDRTNGGIIGVVNPILSRNRFAVCLRGIARAAKKVIIQLSYPTDEVGNRIMNDKDMYKHNINPYATHLNLNEYRAYFGKYVHPFTGIDYVSYYKQIVEEEGAECDIYFANNPDIHLINADTVIICDIHTRYETLEKFQQAGMIQTILLDEIMSSPIGNSGHNARYGLLGSNKASEEKVKLFPIGGGNIVSEIQSKMFSLTGKMIEVMIYGDGVFKDPQGGIWEFADPVVSPAYTIGLNGTPNEVKIKYLADNELRGYSGEALQKKMKEAIQNKKTDLFGEMTSEGTTPRRITDLIGSLCDLTSGSGDKGTPVVLVQGYFDNYATE